jgi:pSer/pThr/pTyr-binding forkhead associated (FHA) protein
MRVVLHVESAGRRRQTLWLRDQQCAEVGRLAYADLVIEDDPQVASLHFALQCSDAGCRIRDLGQSDGTFVNGQRVTLSPLADGDVIRAGRTCFRVLIEDEAPCRLSSTSSPPSAEVAETPQYHDCRRSDSRSCRSDLQPTVERGSIRSLASAAQRAANEPLTVLLKLEDAYFDDYCVWLRDHQVLQVGRSCQADLPVEYDKGLDPFHFELVTDRTNCHLRTCQANQSVLVNQRTVTQPIMLRDGDLIQAGRTRFSVTIRGGGRAIGAPRAVPEPAPRSTTPQSFRYRQENTESGLWHFIGLDAQTPVSELARSLTGTRALYLLVNFAKAKRSIPDWLGPDRDLFAREANSPRALRRVMLVAPDDPLDAGQLWDEMIGSDAAIGLISDLPWRDLLSRLQADPVAFSSPGILREQLSKLPGAAARKLIEEIMAVVMETQILGSWSVLADPGTVSSFAELGFPCSPEAV